MKRMKQMKHKLRSKRGETIAETLIAVLIAAVALVLLASLITTSSKLIRESRDKLDAYYTKNNTLNAFTGDDATIKLEKQDPTTSNYGGLILRSGLGGTTGEITVDVGTNNTFSGKTVVAYRLPTA